MWRNRVSRTLMSLLAVVVVAAVACVPSGGGPSMVSTNETFSGLVNGSGDGAVVTTLCPGPTWPGRLGRAIGGQTLSATRDASGRGNTGDNGAVFAEPNGTTEVVQLTAWDDPRPFPTDIDVPCDGPGVIVFDPCFGFVGCRGAATADRVKVTFVNIAD